MVKRKPKSSLPKLKFPSGWRMEEVTPRMRTPCSKCSQAADKVRFKHTSDGFPFPETKIFCANCAVTAMRAVIQVDVEKVDAVQFYLENQ